MMEFTFNGMVRYGFGFYNPNHAAALICAIFPFLWGWKRYGYLGWGLSFLLAVPLCMTFSRTGVAVLFFELAAWLVFTRFRNWKIIAGIALGLLSLLLLWGVWNRFVIDGAVANRPSIWLAGLKLYAANPQGAGVGNSGKIVSAFLLDGITCRTLVNSHLTLLAEGGIVAGVLWSFMIVLSLMNGTDKPRCWCAFAGLTLSAMASSVFDWDLLTDFRSFGELGTVNFLLSWGLFVLFCGLAVRLLQRKPGKKRLWCAAALAALFVVIPLCFRTAGVPRVEDSFVRLPGGGSGTLVLYGDEWNLKSVLPFCPPGSLVSLKSGLIKKKTKEVFLFGDAAEYAAIFPGVKLYFVAPPEFFTPPPGTERLFLPAHDQRHCSVPVTYY